MFALFSLLLCECIWYPSRLYVMVAQVISHRDIWIESQGNSEDPMANEGKVLHCPRKQRLVRQLIPLSTTHTLSVDNLLRYPSWRSFRLHTLCLASFPVRHLVQILSIYNGSSKQAAFCSERYIHNQLIR